MPEVQGKGLKLEIKLDPALEILNSSKLYVREILQNFITNAIKYTENGSVSISAYKRENGVLFEVRDTGIGVSKQDQAKIFDKFFHRDRNGTAAGNGLGLAIAQSIARAHRGTIEVASQPNQGAMFTVILPSP